MPTTEAKQQSTLHTDNTAYTTSQQMAWLAAWFVNNVGVTLVNKAAFSTVDFHYPNTLSATHMFVNSIGAQLVMTAMKLDAKKVDNKGQWVLFAFSAIFAANISVGNASLDFVSVNFNQVMRSLVPGIIMMIAVLFQGKTFSAKKVQAVVPIVIGVALATFGDLRFSTLGFFLTCLCVVFAALKAIAAGSMLTGEYKLGPFDLLSRMAPLSFMWMSGAAVVTGEVSNILQRWEQIREGWALEVVLLSALMSFTLNITSFMANKSTSALTLAIASNVKQVSLIGLATIIFATPVSALNATGIFIVMVGSALYSQISIQEKERARLKELESQVIQVKKAKGSNV